METFESHPRALIIYLNGPLFAGFVLLFKSYKPLFLNLFLCLFSTAVAFISLEGLTPKRIKAMTEDHDPADSPGQRLIFSLV